MISLMLVIALTGGTLQIQWNAASDPQIVTGPLGDRILLEDAVGSGRPGTPLMPVVPVTALIPQGAIVDGARILLSTEQLADLSFHPMAAQAGAPVSRPEDFTITQPIAAAFSTPIEIKAVVSGQGTLMGYPVADILLSPFSWDPNSNDLVFSSSITIELSYHYGDAGNYVPQRGIAGSETIENILNQTVINPLDARIEPTAPVTDLPWGEYLIIADDDLAASFEPLAQWKTWKGIQTEIVNMSYVTDVYTGVDDAQKLRNFLFDIYQANPPTYILLAGDTPGVPHRNCYATAEGYTDDPSADLYYQDMNDTAPGVDAWNLDGDGVWGELGGDDNMDYHPDYILGRASVETTSEADIFVAKVLAWENAPDTDDWYMSMGFTTGILWSSPYCPGSAGKEKVDTLYTPSTWDITKLYQDTGTQSYTATMAMLNTGMQLVNHSGHGSEGSVSIGTSSLSNSDFMSLTNFTERGRPTIWNTIACLSGSFDTGTCFAEAWIRSPGGGGFCIMNTRYGWGEPAEPGDQWSELVDQEFFAKFFTEDMYNLGVAYMMAKDEFISLIPTDTHYDWIAKSNTLFGDPELPMYSAVPDEIQIGDVFLIKDDTELQVSVTSQGSPLEDARVCLLQGDWNDPVTYAVGITDGSGTATLAWIEPMPALPDSARITVWARDHVTLTDMYPVNNLGIENGSNHSLPELSVSSPNPVQGNASINWTLPQPQNAEIAIVDLAGRTVEAHELLGTAGVFNWNAAENPAGVYFVRMTTQSGAILRHRLVVVR